MYDVNTLFTSTLFTIKNTSHIIYHTSHIIYQKMFAYVKGKLVSLEATNAIIEATGVGYEMRISVNTYTKVQAQVSEKADENVQLFTYLQVLENAHNLFGFAEISEKRLFLDLISVSGIGPNTAIIMLSSLSPAEIQRAIASEDVKTVQSIKGIGAKTAQRAILELKDKMKKYGIPDENGKTSNAPSYRSNKDEALNALLTLGFVKAVAEKNIEMVLKLRGNDLSVENIIKETLKM